MILVRDVFQAKYGKGDALVALFKESVESWSDREIRILTDASGSFFTVVIEEEVESFSVWEENLAATFEHPDFNEWFNKMEPLVESGRREFYNIA